MTKPFAFYVRNGVLNVQTAEGQIVGASPDPVQLRNLMGAISNRYVRPFLSEAPAGARAVVVARQLDNDEAKNPRGYKFVATVLDRVTYAERAPKMLTDRIRSRINDKGIQVEHLMVLEFTVNTQRPTYQFHPFELGPAPGP